MHHIPCICKEYSVATPLLPKATIDSLFPADGTKEVKRKRVLATQSWLTSATDGGEWSVGCKVCGARWKTYNATALARLRRHAELNSHKMNVMKWLEVDEAMYCREDGTMSESLPYIWQGAPPEGMFGTALELYGKGSSARTVASALSISAWKASKLGWCLAEAMFDEDRDFIRSAQSAALIRDEKKPHLFMRFTACNDDLQTHQGMLGSAFLPVTAAGGRVVTDTLTKGTTDILDDFATPRRDPPTKRKREDDDAAGCDKRLLKRLRRITEILGSDAAGDEAASGHEVRVPLQEGMAPLFPRCLAVIFDHTHGCRRITKRGWDADERLSELWNAWLGDSNNLLGVITKSDVFSQWLKDESKKQETGFGVGVKKFSFSGHKHETVQRPLIQAVGNIEAVIRVGQKIIALRGRTSSPGKAAEKFLKMLDAESYLQVAMMCDGSDEAIILSQYTDREDVDNSEKAERCDMFLENIARLFHNGGAVTAQGTFTRMAMDTLQRTLTWSVNGELFSMGGVGQPSEDVVTTCLNHMKCWCRLARAIVEAEFPDFQVVMAFSIFNLGSERLEAGTKFSDITPKQNRDMERLCKILDVDLLVFKEQFMDHRALAERAWAKGTDDKLMCWREALARNSARPEQAAKHPHSELLRVLIRFGAWKASTSGVEQSFGRLALKGVDESHRANMLPDTEQWVFKIAVDYKPSMGRAQRQKLITDAQKIWVEVYQRHRRRSGERVVTRQEIEKKRSTCSEASILRARREAVRQLPASAGGHALHDIPGWGGTHAKEESFQRAKLQARRVAACLDGLLLPDEVDADLRDAAEAEETRQLRC